MDGTAHRDTGLGSLPLPSNRQGKAPRRGWRWFAATAACAAICLAFDAHLKGGPLVGYAPAATWYCYAPDVAAALRALGASPRGAAILDELGPQRHRASVSFRIAMGIRPTPERWRRWCGKRVLVWGEGGEWALCVRPGLLARAADLLFGAGGVGALRKLGDAYYVWHDGFLVASPSPDYLAECVAHLRVFRPAARTPESWVLVQWGATAPSAASSMPHLLVHANLSDPDWEVQSRIGASLPPQDTPMPAGFDWPKPPLLDLRGGTVAEWQALFHNMAGPTAEGLVPTPVRELAVKVWNSWEVDAPVQALIQGSGRFDFALLDLDTSATPPIPECALLCRPEGEGLESLMAAFPPPAERISHAWADTEGFLWPFLGEAVLVAAAPAGDGYAVTSREPMMAPFLEALRKADTDHAGMALRIDFQRLALRAAELVRRGARMELVPGHNEQDLDRDVLPVLRAIGHLGRLELQFKAEGDHVIVRGAFSGGVESRK